MSRFVKLPENLKSWKIITRLSDEKNNEIYKVSKKEFDGTIVSAKLRYINISGESYTSDNVDFINDEVAFLKTVSLSGESFNYIDVAANNNPAKEKIELFIITEDLQTLSECIESKSFNDADIVDFGIQMSVILEKLEANNIFHGNINPDNIYVTADGRYKLGGFSDFESKINDMSFVSPEIYKKENADFTTDIYSLGLIMYYMCNNNTLPFVSESVSKDEAVKTRFEGKAVTAPVNGNEKLKSVIVIACQPINENRWKNAGNIKNALTSIKSELPATSENKNVIIPESTDFEGNVFEEFEYEEFDSTADEVQNDDSEVPPVENAAIITETQNDLSDDCKPNDEDTTDNNENITVLEIEDTTETKPEEPEKTDDIVIEKSETNIENEAEIDNSVFDDYEAEPKVIDFKKQAKEKDYGDYFEDEKESKVTVKAAENSTDVDEKNENLKDNYDYDVFDIEDNKTAENTNKSKKNVIVIVASILVILAALGFIAFCIINGISGKDDNKETTVSTESTSAVETTKTQDTTAQPTTIAATTAEPTTVSSNKEVIPVVGYGYSYAKKLLEEQGFVVEIGEYNYSDEYDEGYVISQSPNGNTTAESGSVVVLDISLGKAEQATEAPAADTSQNSANSSNATNNSYIFANSDSAYLSEAQVNALSRSDLNLALNEIYARRGRIFNDASLSSYFNSQTWYNPRYTADEFEKNVTFNKYEQANLQLIVNVQKEKGYR